VFIGVGDKTKGQSKKLENANRLDQLKTIVAVHRANSSIDDDYSGLTQDQKMRVADYRIWVAYQNIMGGYGWRKLKVIEARAVDSVFNDSYLRKIEENYLREAGGFLDVSKRLLTNGEFDVDWEARMIMEAGVKHRVVKSAKISIGNLDEYLARSLF